LGDDDAGVSGCCDVGDCAELKPEPADVDGRGALALAEQVGDGDLLWAETFSDADGPLTADGDARSGRLGEDAARGRARVRRRPRARVCLLASGSVRPARFGMLTSRPWMAARMAMKAERSATTSISRAPRTMLKKRLMREVLSFMGRNRIQGGAELRISLVITGVAVLPLDLLRNAEAIRCGGGHDGS
jgi:hypothetical protein